MGEVVQIGPWDWLQSTEITKQMDIEQISVNLPWERINQVKDGCVRACGVVGGCVCVWRWWAAGSPVISSGPDFIVIALYCDV